MIRLKFKIFIILILSSHFLYSQVKDSLLNMWLIEANYSFMIPGGDIAERYGVCNTIGGGVTYKTKTNWTLGFEANYLFGNNIKDGTSVFDNLKTESGQIINEYGEYATISLSQRGLYAGIKFGKIFPVIGPNKNSGIITNISTGWLYHHIRIENKDNNAPPVIGDYKKGYDRLIGGYTLKKFIGYQYLSNNEMLNFYFGFEFYQAWTKSLRAYNFDTMEKDDNRYKDLLYSIRVGWIFSIYKKQTDKRYIFK